MIKLNNLEISQEDLIKEITGNKELMETLKAKFEKKDTGWFVPKEDEEYYSLLKEILGTEPTLQDVLLAIDKKFDGNFGTLVINGCLYFLLKNGKQERTFIDLTKSLFNQTDEVKQQLLDLLN